MDKDLKYWTAGTREAQCYGGQDILEEEEESHSKAQLEIFYHLLTALRTVSNTYAQVAWAQSCANRMQHIERLSRVTCRVTCYVVRRDSSAIKF